MARTKKTSRPAIKNLKIEDFQASYQPGLTFPRLMLAIELDGRALSEGDMRDYDFRPGRQWLKIEHQTAGHRCNQRYLIATPLTPKNTEVMGGIFALSTKWFGSQAGCFENPLDLLIDYRADLRRLFKADCNHVHSKLDEGLYPIDIEFLSALAADVLPKDLDELINFQTGWERACGFMGRWNLFVVATNSD